jgi:hypothetical protein
VLKSSVISKKQQKKEKKKREFARRQNRKTGTTDGVVYYRGHSESESGLRWRERERESAFCGSTSEEDGRQQLQCVVRSVIYFLSNFRN